MSKPADTDGTAPVGGSSTIPTTESSTTAPGPTASTQESHLGRNTAIAGAGAGAAGAGALAASQIGGSDSTVPEAQAKIEAERGNPPDPEKLDTAGGLGPHVPGEFPTETGEDPHVPGAFIVTPAEEEEEESRGLGSDGPEEPQVESSGLSSGAGIGAGVAAAAGAVGLGGYMASKSGDDSTTNESTLHPGGKGYPVETAADGTKLGVGTKVAAGAATAAGAVGLGGYMVSREGDGAETDKKDDAKSTSSSSSSSSSDKDDTKDTKEEIPTEGPQKLSEQQDSESHDGRNAAIAGGAAATAGVGGAAAYSSWDRNDTGPASKTIGPHKSNAANIMDPRVKPEPEKMKEKEPITKGPHKSDMMNMMDPRVKNSQPQETQQKEEEETHYGRDAAIVGGAGATGAAGYGAYEYSKDKEPENKEPGSPTKLHKDREPEYKEPASPKYTKEREPENREPASPTKYSKDREPENREPASPTTSGYSHEGSPSNKVAEDYKGHHRLHKKGVEQHGEKKPGLLSKILHRDKSKRESSGSPSSPKESGEASATSSPTSNRDPATGVSTDDQV